MSTATATPVEVCTSCGTYSGTRVGGPSPLLAVCDVLVVKALEAVGKRIVRADRSRFRTLGEPREFHKAHTLWAPDAVMVDKGLIGAWDVIPALMVSHGLPSVSPAYVRDIVDGYTRALLRDGRLHSTDLLRWRLETVLGFSLTPATL